MSDPNFPGGQNPQGGTPYTQGVPPSVPPQQPMGQPGYPPPQGYGQPYGQPMGQPGGYMPPPSNFGQGSNPATSIWGKRAIAYIIDYLILLIPNIIIYSIFAFVVFSSSAATYTYAPNGVPTYSPGASTSIFVIMIVTMLVIAILDMFYFAYFDGQTDGGTIGKKVMKIAVRDANTGQRPTLVMAGLRMLVFGLLFAFCYIPGIINALWPLWGAGGKAWHDMITNTQIVEVG